MLANYGDISGAGGSESLGGNRIIAEAASESKVSWRHRLIEAGSAGILRRHYFAGIRGLAVKNSKKFGDKLNR